jgi:hypothetical protein
MNHKTTLLLAAVSILVWPLAASSRLLEPWPYSRLFQDADLVVIARVLSANHPAHKVKDQPPDSDLEGSKKVSGTVL